MLDSLNHTGGINHACRQLSHSGERLHATQRGIRRVLSMLIVVPLFSIGCRKELPPRPYDDSTVESQPSTPPATTFPHSGPKGRRMLLVHSYHEGYRWDDTITEGVRSAIEGTGLELDIFYMDAKGHTDEAWKVDAGAGQEKESTNSAPTSSLRPMTMPKSILPCRT